MQIGTATARAGELTHGWLDATSLPTGGEERFPVSIARGEDEGPTLWITGGVHGDEATGIAVAQDVMREDLHRRLAGTVVCVPLVNPAGVRRNARTSYYHDDDPNRYFPDSDTESTRPPRTQERIDERLYDVLVDTADALVDLHTAQIRSVPFTIRDRVLYGDRRTRDDAESLAGTLQALVDAFGFPTLTEYPAAEYLDENLHRSTAGAVLNEAGIPAFTVELGGHSVVEEETRAGGVAGVYAAMAELGMLDAVPAAVGGPDEYVPDAPVDYPVRRAVHPHTETPGLVRHRVEAGDAVAAGDVVADIVTPHGTRLETIRTDHDGYVIGRHEGLAAYEGDAIASMAVRDTDELVVHREAK
ncbi:succinylglutamate desuccinylase/aspartoacylase family protein [Haloferacaceae archaeon DSL9]